MDKLQYIWLTFLSFITGLFGSGQQGDLLANDRDDRDALPIAPPEAIVVRQDEKHPCPNYMALKRKFRDIGRMQAIAETMGRDFLTAMPEGAWKSRLSQIAYLHRRIHEDMSDPDVLKKIENAQSHLANNVGDWDEWDTANLTEIHRTCERARHVDGDLTEKEARIAYEGRRQHRHALATGDWMQGREYLSRAVDLKRQVAEAICKGTGKNDPYQVLLDEFLPGADLGQVEKWFETMRKDLTKMLPKIVEKQAAENPVQDLTDFYPAKAQMWLNEALLKMIGFDFDRGGLYETGHNPVEGGTPEDTRLVIKSVDTTNFMDSMKSALHEGGHGIYIQGLPRKTWRYQPVGQDLGATIHESQALLIEMIIGRTKEFFEFLSPRLEGLFHGLKNPMLSAENLYKYKTRVASSVDRKRADEVTYFFHVLLRFRLERDLIDGYMKVGELPDKWAEASEELLGKMPESDKEGCLQDVHWFVGKFGYFPAYAVGHMCAAQQYEAMQKDINNLSSHIGQGDFNPVLKWTRDNIHKRGRILSVDDLMTEATGAAPSPDALLKHLEGRYLGA